jgi:hypothetical protein
VCDPRIGADQIFIFTRRALGLIGGPGTLRRCASMSLSAGGPLISTAMISTSRPAMRIDEAILDANLLGAGLGDPATWKPWLSILKAAFGLPLTEDEQVFYEAVSGARVAPQTPVSELWAIGKEPRSSRYRDLDSPTRSPPCPR